MKNYYFKDNKFIIENYLQKSTFSNFLPGIAGKAGIPLWAFYVNRGQGISGFGLMDKNHPIMEFSPANKAYETVSTIGFRTFIKANGKYYEPFLPTNEYTHRMAIERDSFTIEEENKELGIKIQIKYFGLPSENIGGLVRKVNITNISNKDINLEVLDGLTEILPSGVANGNFKEMSNLLTSWMDVKELENNFAFYTLRSSTGDSSEVKEVHEGNYFFGLIDNKLVQPIVDQDLIFGYDSSKIKALSFAKKGINGILKEEQVKVNKIPCGFIPYIKKLNQNERLEINIVSGFAHDKEHLRAFIEKAKQDEYINKKENESQELIEDLVNDVLTDSGNQIFNEYIKQNYLDNLLRGGYPYQIGDKIYHLYSRKHGDLERDYNFFTLIPEFYSQGAGNFRDVCQNRRMDSFIHREVKEHNIEHFASLIQLDGYNPLTIFGITFTLKDKETMKSLIKKHFLDKHKEISEFLSNKFTPGGFVRFIYNNNVQVVTDELTYLNDFINNSDKHYESNFGEGYWSDHFTYIIDLVESYEGIYPDKIKDLLFNKREILSFESPVTVRERNEKAVLTDKGTIRQYGALRHFDEDRMKRLNISKYGSNWAKLGSHIYKTNLFTKLLILALNKHSLLDSENLGVEMDAGKPGWNDAMNGLPGLFGSGVSETIELKRIVSFLNNHIENEDVILPKEVYDLFKGLSTFKDYENRLHVRDRYRSSIRFGLSEELIKVNHSELKQYLTTLDEEILDNLNDLYHENDEIIPTFIEYEVDSYIENKNNGEQVIGDYGLPLVKPLTYKKRYLSKFLEAPARLLKTDFDKDKLRNMYKAIKNSDIYDKKLKIYKTSGCLNNEDYEIGRIRAFTKGWLERESDFLHMIYKYMIGLLKAGLYKEFYEEIKTNFVCYMDPEVYGRNILENSSFIAPSNNPNPHIHGKGFLPRLSGSTVEIVEIWAMMMTGGNPFKLKDGKLIFKPKPLFSKEYFKEDKTLTFRFMKDVDITYISDTLFDTYESCKISKIELFTEEAKEVIYQDYLEENQALKIRQGFYKEIKIYIKKY